MVLNNINGSLNKWLILIERERASISVGALFLFISYYNLLNMKVNYLILLDCSVGELIKIRLTEQEKIESEEYEDYEEFICTLEDKYDFKLSNCSWMCCEILSERSFFN